MWKLLGATREPPHLPPPTFPLPHPPPLPGPAAGQPHAAVASSVVHPKPSSLYFLLPSSATLMITPGSALKGMQAEMPQRGCCGLVQPSPPAPLPHLCGLQEISTPESQDLAIAVSCANPTLWSCSRVSLWSCHHHPCTVSIVL